MMPSLWTRFDSSRACETADTLAAHLRRLTLLASVALQGTLAIACSAQATQRSDTAVVRRDLEEMYRRNVAAFLKHDVDAIMALRAPNFHAVMPDGSIRDHDAMRLYTVGFLNGVKKWNGLTLTIDSLRVTGDTAFAIVAQHADRMALRPDNAVHHVETWVTQRETWIRHGDRWLMWRVDQLRDQRRHIDGKPG